MTMQSLKSLCLVLTYMCLLIVVIVKNTIKQQQNLHWPFWHQETKYPTWSFYTMYAAAYKSCHLVLWLWIGYVWIKCYCLNLLIFFFVMFYFSQTAVKLSFISHQPYSVSYAFYSAQYSRYTFHTSEHFI